MPTKSIKEDIVGDPPICHSIELLQLSDHAFQVVARLVPMRCDWEPGTHPQPNRQMMEFSTRAEADLYYRGMLRQLQRLGPP